MDSVAAIVGCMQKTTERLRLPPIPAETIRDTIGLGLDDTLDRLLPDSDERERARVIAGYGDLWRAHYHGVSTPFEGVERTLAALSRRGHLLAVATGKSRRGLDRDFETTGFGRFFAASRTADEALPKPDPRMLLDLLDELAVESAEALMIGDTTHDLEMARAAGVPAVAVTSGSHGPKVLERLEPLCCLGSVCELEEWLGG